MRNGDLYRRRGGPDPLPAVHGPRKVHRRAVQEARYEVK
jgi:hypothetical protein